METALEKLLDFYAQIGVEVIHDTEYNWDGNMPDGQMVSLDDDAAVARFIFDKDGKYVDKWFEVK